MNADDLKEFAVVESVQQSGVNGMSIKAIGAPTDRKFLLATCGDDQSVTLVCGHVSSDVTVMSKFTIPLAHRAAVTCIILFLRLNCFFFSNIFLKVLPLWMILCSLLVQTTVYVFGRQ